MKSDAAVVVATLKSGDILSGFQTQRNKGENTKKYAVGKGASDPNTNQLTKHSREGGKRSKH